MLSNIWVYKKTSKVMISLLLAAVLVLATQNWLLGLLMFIVTAAAVVWVKRSDLMQERLVHGLPVRKRERLSGILSRDRK